MSSSASEKPVSVSENTAGAWARSIAIEFYTTGARDGEVQQDSLQDFEVHYRGFIERLGKPCGLCKSPIMPQFDYCPGCGDQIVSPAEPSDKGQVSEIADEKGSQP